MSTGKDVPRAVTRSTSKGQLIPCLGTSQPVTEGVATFKDKTEEPISNDNLLSQVQKLIQHSQEEIKNSMENIQVTIEMNRHIMQAQLEELKNELLRLKKQHGTI
jgi:hypothetical protein